jgi:hypothetical protein
MLAGHQVEGDVEATRSLRADLLAAHLLQVEQLVTVNAKDHGNRARGVNRWTICRRLTNSSTLLGRAKNLSKSEVADELDMQAQALRDAEVAEE